MIATTLPQLQLLLNKRGVFDMLGIKRIGVFGSFARGGDYNDIDLLLDEEPGYQKRELLKRIIETELAIPCDVVVKKHIEPIILYYLNKDLQYVQKQ